MVTARTAAISVFAERILLSQAWCRSPPIGGGSRRRRGIFPLPPLPTVLLNFKKSVYSLVVNNIYPLFLTIFL